MSTSDGVFNSSSAAAFPHDSAHHLKIDSCNVAPGVIMAFITHGVSAAANVAVRRASSERGETKRAVGPDGEDAGSATVRALQSR
jgi:hypothetical protein